MTWPRRMASTFCAVQKFPAPVPIPRAVAIDLPNFGGIFGVIPRAWGDLPGP
jgi:hypothetical protein